MIFASRNRKDPDVHLDRKVHLFFLGALLALIGIGLGSSFLVSLAILVLLVGLALRFLPSGIRSEPPEDVEE